MADETYPRQAFKANVSTAVARHGLFSGGVRRVPVFRLLLLYSILALRLVQRKMWPDRLCVASSCDLLIVLSTDGDRPCKRR